VSKSTDLLRGALRVFARDGYSRSKVVDIADEASVSTRTIYNQHGSKSELFTAVLEFSTRQMADHQIELVRGSLDGLPISEAIAELAERWVRRDDRFTAHQALVRQVQAEREHIPQAALDTWVSLGPLRVRAVLQEELARLFAEARMTLHDPATAATHLLQLIVGDPITRGFYRAEPFNDDHLVAMARRGAEVFCLAYASPTLTHTSS
jgi:AcrR family transcriptional regulator